MCAPRLTWRLSMAQGGMRVGNTRGITEASPGSRFPTIRVSDRSGTPPQWLPMFLASAQPPSPPLRSPSPSPPPLPPPSPPLSPPLPSPSPPRLARDLGAAGAAAVIGGYFFVNIVIIAIVKIYLRFRDWDRVELCRVLRMRVVSSCDECVAKVRSGPRARTDADADATAAPLSRL